MHDNQEIELTCTLMEPARLDIRRVATLPPRQMAGLLVEAARDNPRMHSKLEALLCEVPAPAPENYMVGESPALREVFDRIRRFAPTGVPVLITGESGTGKELAAQALHQRSLRASGPFVTLNCAALPASLIASELFGHEKGAFTGAAARRIGHLEAAEGGTVFLDEIGDLPLEIQGHLLRFLQEGRITRLGATRPITLDVRVVSATHVPLEHAIRERRFREDLFYRLNVLYLHMPPLRERGDDLSLLANWFLRQITEEFSCQASLSDEAMAAIRAHPWPGNVRELIAVLRRSVLMAKDPVLRPADLGLTLPERAARRGPEELMAALQAAGGNVALAARNLRVSRVTLYRQMQRYAIQPQPSRTAAPVIQATDT